MGTASKPKEASLSHDYLLTQIRYDPITGEFWWVAPKVNRKMGLPVGKKSTAGHLQIVLDGKLWQAHRLAWFYVTKSWPEHDIDHINTCKTDNRFCNLRLATRTQNCGNKGANKNNKLGIKGVVMTKTGRFEACIRIKGKSTFLGTFQNADEASRAYEVAALGAFGEFARVA